MKKTTIFSATNDKNVINKKYLETKLSKIEGQTSYKEKNYNEDNLHNKEELLIERAVGSTIQILYDKGLFDNNNNGNEDQVLKGYLLVDTIERRGPFLEKVIDDDE